MPKKKKLNLGKLKVQSFVTDLSGNTNQVKGGAATPQTNCFIGTCWDCGTETEYTVCTCDGSCNGSCDTCTCASGCATCNTDCGCVTETCAGCISDPSCPQIICTG